VTTLQTSAPTPAWGLTSALLLLGDSRLPVGGHAHSAGAEAAVVAGLVRDVDQLADFLQGRLFSAGLTAAALAAAACRLAADATGTVRTTGDTTDVTGTARLQEQVAVWERLDAEVDARVPSPAARAASRAQGRAVLRLGRDCWPHPSWDLLGPAPHHAVALGVATAACAGTPRDAAVLCAQAGTGGPASAALRLLGLDPAEVTELLSRLAPSIDAVAGQAAALAARAGDDLAALPARGAPMLDIHAENHAAAEVRLFAS
jgi:urease accessory protein